MTLSTASKPLLLLAAAALTLGLAACSTDGEAPTTGEPAGTDSTTGDEGRAFDSTDDAVIIAVETALRSSNAKAEWQGATLRVNLDGSAEAPTASLYCSAAEAVIADTESVVLVYSDGEIICDDRPGAR